MAFFFSLILTNLRKTAPKYRSADKFFKIILCLKHTSYCLCCSNYSVFVSSILLLLLLSLTYYSDSKN